MGDKVMNRVIPQDFGGDFAVVLCRRASTDS
jgi:hypothetical protein